MCVLFGVCMLGVLAVLAGPGCILEVCVLLYSCHLFFPLFFLLCWLVSLHVFLCWHTPLSSLFPSVLFRHFFPSFFPLSLWLVA